MTTTTATATKPTKAPSSTAWFAFVSSDADLPSDGVTSPEPILRTLSAKTQQGLRKVLANHPNCVIHSIIKGKKFAFKTTTQITLAGQILSDNDDV